MGYVKERFSPTGNETADFTVRMSCSDSHNMQDSCIRPQQLSAVVCVQLWATADIQERIWEQIKHTLILPAIYPTR